METRLGPRPSPPDKLYCRIIAVRPMPSRDSDCSCNSNRRGKVVRAAMLTIGSALPLLSSSPTGICSESIAAYESMLSLIPLSVHTLNRSLINTFGPDPIGNSSIMPHALSTCARRYGLQQDKERNCLSSHSSPGHSHILKLFSYTQTHAINAFAIALVYCFPKSYPIRRA